MVTRISLVLALLVVRQKQGLVGGADLQVTGLNFSNHSMNATTDKTPTSSSVTEKEQKNSDNSFRSEVYKMHANGLMLLHAQRTRSGIEAKKSQLNNKLVNSGINYHIRKKSNDTVNAVQDNERHLEAKLGDLPQVRQRRANNAPPKDNSQVVREHDYILCAHSVKYNMTNNVRCHRRHHHRHRHQHRRHRHHRHHHDHRHRHRHHWRSIVQGEDVSGEEVKKTRVYPEKLEKNKKSKSPETIDNSHDDVKVEADLRDLRNILMVTKRQTENVGSSDGNLKLSRLKRALTIMGGHFDENSLDDSQQSQTVTVDQNLHKEIGDIPEIGSLQDNGDEVSPSRLRNTRVKLFYDLQEPSSDALEPLMDISRIPKIDDDLFAGGETSIPRIRPIKSLEEEDDERNAEVGDETTGDRRASVSKDEFADDDLDDRIASIRGVTPPTPIPFLTEISTISNIPPITDLPTLRSISAPKATSSSEGRKLSHVERTEEGNSTTVQFGK